MSLPSELGLGPKLVVQDSTALSPALFATLPLFAVAQRHLD